MQIGRRFVAYGAPPAASGANEEASRHPATTAEALVQLEARRLR